MFWDGAVFALLTVSIVLPGFRSTRLLPSGNQLFVFSAREPSSLASFRTRVAFGGGTFGVDYRAEEGGDGGRRGGRGVCLCCDDNGTTMDAFCACRLTTQTRAVHSTDIESSSSSFSTDKQATRGPRARVAVSSIPALSLFASADRRRRVAVGLYTAITSERPISNTRSMRQLFLLLRVCRVPHACASLGDVLRDRGG
ncbi:hypothetical protein MRX96_004751 [Rhipicephalus microplus]